MSHVTLAQYMHSLFYKYLPLWVPTFITGETLTLTDHYHPEPIIYTGVHSVMYILWVWLNMLYITICRCGIIYFHSHKNLSFSLQLLTTTYFLLYPYFCLFQNVLDWESQRHSLYKMVFSTEYNVFKIPPCLFITL